MDLIKKYYVSLKPERTYANVMTAAAGFLFACKWNVEWALLLSTLLGMILVVMSACAVNNCTDYKLDENMPRTKRRPTVTGHIPIKNLLILAMLMGVLGFGILIVQVNLITVLLGVIGYVDYVVLYGWTKRRTPWSTLIGTISGSVPIMAGYTAVAGRFDLTALSLGLVMLFWQMSHFYSIGMFRLADYTAAHVPIWPVKYGIRNTQAWTIAYTVLFVLSVGLLVAIGSTGLAFAIVIGLMSAFWLRVGVKGFTHEKPEKWARGMFGLSLLTLLVFSVGLVLAPLLP